MTSYHTVNIEPGSVEQSIHTDDGLIALPRPRPLMGIVSQSCGWEGIKADDFAGHDGLSRPIHGG